MMAKKHNTGKRFLPWLMVLSMTLALLPVNAFAEESNEGTADTASYCPDSDSKESSNEGAEASESKDAEKTPSAEKTVDASKKSEASSDSSSDSKEENSSEEKNPSKDENSSEEEKEVPSVESISTTPAASKTAVVFANEGAANSEETYYPVYVYACFANNGTLLNRGHNRIAALVTNGVEQEIAWNADASQGWYYITFGKVEEGTTEKPVKGASAKFTDNWDDMLDFEGIGSAKDNGFALSDVEDWGDLGFSTGATGFDTGNSWHLDGTINVYAVTYAANGEGVSGLPESSKDSRKYYRGTYTVATDEPKWEGYTFLGWKLDGEENLLHAGDEIALDDDVTLTAEWKKNASDSSETTRHPVYVYARFMNGTKHLGGEGVKIFKNGEEKAITWNPDSNRNIHYITFGHVTDGTAVAPANGVAATFTGNLEDMIEFSGYGNASENGFALSDVTTWISLNYNMGATGFHSNASWHLDGNIQVYTVAYADGVEEASTEAVENMPKRDENFNCGTYTVAKEIPTREGYTFDGWTLDGEKVGETINLAEISDKNAAEITLVAQWTKDTVQPTPSKKRHHSEQEEPVTEPVAEPVVEIADDEALGLNNTDHFAYIVGYGNGEVRPQNSITRAEVAAIFYRLLEDDVRNANYTRENSFTDVSADAWYCSAVSTLSAMGILSGYPDATFRPNASITRAEFAAIATRFDANGDKTPVSFDDITNHWAKDEIAAASNNGWVNGYEDGSFRPQNKITRAETMSLTNRVLKRKPETAEDLLSNMKTFTDNTDVNAWYYLAVQEATNSHLYIYKENSDYEKWTELSETRDWSE